MTSSQGDFNAFPGVPMIEVVPSKTSIWTGGKDATVYVVSTKRMYDVVAVAVVNVASVTALAVSIVSDTNACASVVPSF